MSFGMSADDGCCAGLRRCLPRFSRSSVSGGGGGGGGDDSVVHSTVRQRLKEATPKANKATTPSRRTPGGSKRDIATLLFCPDPKRPLGKHYEVEKQLGEGGFGAVFSAKHTLTGEKRAIKQVPKSDIQDDMSYVHVELEAMVVLDHPHVVKCYEFFEDAKMLYIVAELCNAGDFSELNHGIDDPLEIRLLFRDLLMAVRYCHDREIAHRDLKFENCLLQKEPHQRHICKVIDFGLSAIRRTGDKDSMWLDDQLGTRFFVAPEVIDHTIKYGVGCDLWSIGIMAYIVLTDEHPFHKNACNVEMEELFRAILQSPMRMSPVNVNSLSKDARDFLCQLLEKDPAKRIDAHAALRHPWLATAATSSGAAAAGACAAKGSGAGRDAWKTSRRGGEGCGSGSGGSSAEMIGRLQHFGKASKFERAVLTLAAHQASRKEVEDLRVAFMELDTDHTGSLEMEEIQRAFEQCGHKMSDEEFHELFDALDANESGKVHYTEWLAATLKPSHLASDLAINQVFQFFDIEGNGRISREELMQVLDDEEQVQEVLRRGDTAGDGMLSKKEFTTLMKNMAETYAKKS